MLTAPSSHAFQSFTSILTHHLNQPNYVIAAIIGTGTALVKHTQINRSTFRSYHPTPHHQSHPFHHRSLHRQLYCSSFSSSPVTLIHRRPFQQKLPITLEQQVLFFLSPLVSHRSFSSTVQAGKPATERKPESNNTRFQYGNNEAEARSTTTTSQPSTPTLSETSPILSEVVVDVPSASSSPVSDSTILSISDSRYRRAWLWIKKEALHYWNGTKLLAADIRVAAGLTWQVLHGHELNRRERKQLTRTSADILRLIPFLVIVIVPFMEFSLPFLLKIFPNMLPSTYLDHKGEEAKLKKEIAGKVEIARFLQDTTALMASQLLIENPSTSLTAAATTAAAGTSNTAEIEKHRITISKFQSLMAKVKRGESVKNDDILAVTRLFDEDFTLENLNHGQLAAMCRLLNIRVFGSDWVLRYKLNQKMDKIRADDKLIEKEGGVNSLSLDELREACRTRGIRSDRSEEYMKRKLNDWLILSLHHDVPISLLVLSRAFSQSLADRGMTADLADTLKHIPDAVVEEIQHSIVDMSSDSTAKLALIRQEQQKKRETATTDAEEEHRLQIAAHTAVGLTTMKEQMGDIKEANDEIEGDIDEATDEVKKKEQQPLHATSVASHAAAVAPAPDVSDSESLPPVPVVAAVDQKKVAKVNVLNDRVEALLNKAKLELQQHEQQTQKEAQQPQRKPKSDNPLPKD